MEGKKKKITVSVINDLVTDQRVNRTCLELHLMGYDVLVVGRKLKTSLPMPTLPYSTKRMKLWVTKGALFYAWYNWRLFWLLLFTKTDVFWSNDLDTLLANRWASKLKRKPLVFDSHEYFTEVPELEHNTFAKKVWKSIEGSIVPKLKHCITVNESIALLFKEKYGNQFNVIRNVPLKNNTAKQKNRKDLGMPEDKIILILQGSGINVDRGAEELVLALKILPDNYHLYIVGSGDVIHILKKMADDENLHSKITFVGKQPYNELIQYTMNADAGITLDKNTNINYELSLPNKIFDYIQSGIPVISSDLIELRKVITHYQVGSLVKEVTPEAIANSIQVFFTTPLVYQQAKANTIRAAAELNWEVEKKVLYELMEKIN